MRLSNIARRLCVGQQDAHCTGSLRRCGIREGAETRIWRRVLRSRLTSGWPTNPHTAADNFIEILCRPPTNARTNPHQNPHQDSHLRTLDLLREEAAAPLHQHHRPRHRRGVAKAVARIVGVRSDQTERGGA